MNYQVFISHSSKDSELARDLARRLKEAGVRVFADVEGVSVGEDLSRTVHRALRDADEVVIVTAQVARKSIAFPTVKNG
jgi:hypothetical protein